MDHFKILAIIDADKRVFRDADVNTVVVILEKVEGEDRKDKRDTNLVKFVRIKARLEIDEIIEYIKKHDEYFSDEKIRIYPKRQKDLWEEGFDKEKHRYIGSKWGKYVQAPEIFFTIVKKGREKLTKLGNLSNCLEIETYLNTGGANAFFFIPKSRLEKGSDETLVLSVEDGKTFEIERKFLTELFKSSRECRKIIPKENMFKFKLLQINKKLKGHEKALEYISWGEKEGYNKVSGRKGKRLWYILPDQAFTSGLNLIGRIHNDRHICYFNIHGYVSSEFYRIHNKGYASNIALNLILNSTLTAFFKELCGKRNLGQAALKTDGSDLKDILLPSPEIAVTLVEPLEKLAEQTDIYRRGIGSIFEEIGAETSEEVSLDKVKVDRKSLDDIIFDILELSQEERLEVYRAVIDLVRRRLAKAEEIEVLVGPEVEREKPWPLSSKGLEELVTLLQLSKVGRLTEEQESTLGRRAGRVVRDLAYETIRLRHEPMSVNELTQSILDIGDDVLSLAGYYEVISEVMGGKTKRKQVIRDLLSIWRDHPEGIERTVSRLLSGDGRFLQIESDLFGLKEWSPNELFQIYVQLMSKYRITNYEKKETFKGEAISLLESGEVDFPDKEGLIQTLRRL